MISSIVEGLGVDEVFTNATAGIETMAQDGIKHLVIITLCRKGNHRSEAARLLLTATLQAYKGKVTKSTPLTARCCKASNTAHACDVHSWTERDYKSFAEQVQSVMKFCKCKNRSAQQYYEEAQADASLGMRGESMASRVDGPHYITVA